MVYAEPCYSTARIHLIQKSVIIDGDFFRLKRIAFRWAMQVNFFSPSGKIYQIFIAMNSIERV